MTKINSRIVLPAPYPILSFTNADVKAYNNFQVSSFAKSARYAISPQVYPTECRNDIAVSTHPAWNQLDVAINADIVFTMKEARTAQNRGVTRYQNGTMGRMVGIIPGKNMRTVKSIQVQLSDGLISDVKRARFTLEPNAKMGKNVPHFHYGLRMPSRCIKLKG